MRLVAATYNVQSFRAGVERAVEVLAPERPDVVLIQESGPRRILKRFAGAMEMKFVSSHRLFTRVQNAVLFRAPWRVSNVDVQDLPPQGHTHPRGFVVARLRAHGTRLTAVAAHLGLVPIERFHHARLVADHLAGVDGALILGADVNEGPEGPTARWLSERMFDAAVQSGGDGGPTFPAWAPTARIDYVFVNQLAPIVRAWVPSGQATREASDHRPVLAEVELSAEGSL